MSASSSVVVWQSAFLGDLVLSSNLLLNLKPFAERILLVARPFAAELFRGADWIEVRWKKASRAPWRSLKK